mgnify:CR=1 FL=1
MQNEDPTASSRKQDHIELAFASQTPHADERFYYEPLFTGNHTDIHQLACHFAGHQLEAPIWISSMTGGTEKAGHINKNLAALCQEFGLGMGLGSCRSLLTSDEYLDDFRVRPYMGDQPLYANLGIAQVEKLLADGKETIIVELVKKLEANGLIIHINPLQEWFQPEGDRYYEAPIVTISRLLERTKLNLIVKEVGHGMGPASLQALMQLPIDAIEFAAFGGTNFSKLEMLRDKTGEVAQKQALAYVGHTAVEMVGYVNNILSSQEVLCRNFIISGGISSYLDGAYLIAECHGEAIYGQASGFLKHAMGTYEALRLYTRQQIEGLAMSRQILKNKKLATNG